MTIRLAAMFSASCTICLKGIPTLKQLRQFQCSKRISSSNKASSRSSSPFFRTGNSFAPGSNSVSGVYGSSKTWSRVRLASNCFARVSAYRIAVIDSGRRSVGTRTVLISTGDHRSIFPGFSTSSIIKRVAEQAAKESQSMKFGCLEYGFLGQSHEDRGFRVTDSIDMAR